MSAILRWILKLANSTNKQRYNKRTGTYLCPIQMENNTNSPASNTYIKTALLSYSSNSLLKLFHISASLTIWITELLQSPAHWSFNTKVSAFVANSRSPGYIGREVFTGTINLRLRYTAVVQSDQSSLQELRDLGVCNAYSKRQSGCFLFLYFSSPYFSLQKCYSCNTPLPDTHNTLCPVKCTKGRAVKIHRPKSCYLVA